MEQRGISEPFEQGAVLFPGLEFRAMEKPWYSHPARNGVFLKDPVTTKETGGAFSYHLVRVSRNCEVADHDHELQWVWNVVPAGKGSFLVDGREAPVAQPGQTVVTPPRTHHTVSAGNDELSLLAPFVPALA
ncbi:MAG TPA: cupin domain-containing protein [Methanoregulaceae archaeon]|nr:cupin domain-containing protein [Methanoregulaceae archaeon]